MRPLATHTRAMPPKFTAEEYRQAAQACRAAAFTAQQDAKKQSNPQVAKTFEDIAIGYRQLAAKFELAALQSA